MRLIHFCGIFLFIFFRSIKSQCSTPTSTTNTITQYGITWTFDQQYDCGKFFNGDYYVVDPGSGVVVTSVSPPPSTTAPIRNGSMINPETGFQSYDDRIGYFSASKGVSYPTTLYSPSSLVSSISLLTSNCHVSGGTEPGNIALNGACIPYEGGRPKLKTAAVLTVLSSRVTADYFRPPYIGSAKPLYTINQVNYSLLPNLPPVNDIDSNLLSYLERGFERPWIHHITDWGARLLHPMDNMLDYHAKISSVLQQASALVLMDFNGNTTNLVNLMIQNGLDYYAMAVNGSGTSAFQRWPLYFTGMLLDEDEITSIFRDGRCLSNPRTDEKCYYLEDRVSSMVSAWIVPGLTWTGHSVGWRQESVNPLNAEHEHLHPSEWIRLENNGNYPGGGSKRESYRVCCNSFNYVGLHIAALSMNAHSLWDHDAFFDYVDRWMTEDMSVYAGVNGFGHAEAAYGTSGVTFINNLWHTYRDNFGCRYTGTNLDTKKRLYVCDGVSVDCGYLASAFSSLTCGGDYCNNYPNQRAFDYDPCQFNCEDSGEYNYNVYLGIERIISLGFGLASVVIVLLILILVVGVVFLFSFVKTGKKSINSKK